MYHVSASLFLVLRILRSILDVWVGVRTEFTETELSLGIVSPLIGSSVGNNGDLFKSIVIFEIAATASLNELFAIQVCCARPLRPPSIQNAAAQVEDEIPDFMDEFAPENGTPIPTHNEAMQLLRWVRKMSYRAALTCTGGSAV